MDVHREVYIKVPRVQGNIIVHSCCTFKVGFANRFRDVVERRSNLAAGLDRVLVVCCGIPFNVGALGLREAFVIFFA